MNKLTYLLLGAGGLLLASCSQEEIFTGNTTGNTANITLELSTPEIQSRSFSDGKSANLLQYAVYKVENDSYSKVGDEVEVKNFTGTTTINVQLANEFQYSIVIWAANEADETENAYKVEFGDNSATMTVDYTKTEANNDNLDAFYVYYDLGKVSGDRKIGVELLRPFAQVNVGTNDFDEYEQSSGKKVENTAITISNAYSKLDLISGDVSEPQEGTFSATKLPSRVSSESNYEKFPKDSYDYLAMAYVLVGNEGENFDVTYSYSLEDESETKDRKVTNVPLKRNHRTNLYGSLLTGILDVEVEVKPGFSQDYEQEVVDVEDGKVSLEGETYNSLGEAIAAAQQKGLENPVFYLGETGEEEDNVIVVNDELGPKTRAESSFKSITIKGAGDATNTILYFKNQSVYYNDKDFVLNFENITMKREASTNYTESTVSSFIRIGQENYTNCIIEGCVMLFIEDSASFVNCTFNNETKSGFPGYSIYYYAYSGSKLLVENCEFNVQSKAIVLYSEAANCYDLTVNNSVFNAAQKDDKSAIQMHTEAGAIYGTVRINKSKANNFDETRNGGLWFEEKNNAPVLTPTTNFDVYIDGELIQSSSLIRVDGKTVSSVAEALEAATDGSSISIPEGEYDGFNFQNAKDFTAKNVTIDCNGSVFTGENQMVFDETTVIKNAKIVTKQRGNGFTNQFIAGQFEDCIFEGEDGNGLYVYTSSDVKFTRCQFIASEERALFFGENKYTATMIDCEMQGYCPINEPMTVIFEGCKFLENQNGYAGIGVRGTSTFTNCEFTFTAPYFDHKEIALKKAGYDYTFTGCKVNGQDFDPKGEYMTIDQEGISVIVNGQKVDVDKTDEKPKK